MLSIINAVHGCRHLLNRRQNGRRQNLRNGYQMMRGVNKMGSNDCFATDVNMSCYYGLCCVRHCLLSMQGVVCRRLYFD